MSTTSNPKSLSRRAFVSAAAVAAAYSRALPAPAESTPPATVVNDIHSRLNATRVAGTVRPTSVGALRRAVRRAAANHEKISLAAARHAMGGQQFGTDSLLIDMSGLRGVISFDRDAGIVEVESGIEWPDLVAWLARRQRDEPGAWGIVQKQTGADRLSIGGALSANVHGRGLRHRPIIQDVESFVLMGANGVEKLCSREHNAELFSLAIGGYGLFGPIVSVRLRLARRHKVERVVEVLDLDDIVAAFEQRIAAGFEFGDFQFATDESDVSFMRRGVFSCYRPVAADTPLPANRAELSEAEWMQLAYLAHTDRKQAFETYAGFYLSTSGQVYWSDTHQMSVYRDDYHTALSQRLGEPHAASEMISELYVPRPALPAFMDAASAALRDASVPLIYGTVRLIERDDESYLAWAREPWACVIFNLHIDHTDTGVARARGVFRRLIDTALDHGGSYYLTYHRWARRDQVQAAHPRLPSFLRRKRRYDPQERFQSDWYRHYRGMFADARLG